MLKGYLCVRRDSPSRCTAALHFCEQSHTGWTWYDPVERISTHLDIWKGTQDINTTVLHPHTNERQHKELKTYIFVIATVHI